MKPIDTFFVFLDIDGVLNHESQWKISYSLDDYNISAFCTFLKQIPFSCSIILVSSWRDGFLSTGNQKNTLQLKELEEKLQKYGCSLTDSVPKHKTKKRLELIQYYLRRHTCKNYLIIDDDLSEYDGIKPSHLYLVNSNTGFTEKDIGKCSAFCSVLN